VDLIVELTDEIVMRHFTDLGRNEIRRMFKLDDICKSRVWQEAHEVAREGATALVKQQIVKRLQAKRKSVKEIADLLEMPLAEVRRLARR
jgi:predicted transposase YdaD